MRRPLSMALIAAISVSLGACKKKNTGDDDNDPSPTNNNPTISSLNVTPTFAMAGLASISGTAAATDPDGDSLTFVWDVSTNNNGAPASGGSPLVTYNGANFTHQASGSGAQTARLTVTDSRGGSVSETRNFTVGSLTGNWTFTLVNNNTGCASTTFQATLTQSGGTVTGTQSYPNGFCNVTPGTTGNTDPAAPGTVNAAGAVVLRFKVGIFPDFRFEGTMQSDGRTVEGGFFQSGFTGQTARMNKN